MENLSKLYNKSIGTIHKRLQLLYLPEDLQNAIETKVEKKREKAKEARKKERALKKKKK